MINCSAYDRHSNAKFFTSATKMVAKTSNCESRDLAKHLAKELLGLTSTSSTYSWSSWANRSNLAVAVTIGFVEKHALQPKYLFTIKFVHWY